MNVSTIQGNQNIVIQSVSDSTLTVNVNGELQQIQNEFEEIKKLIQNLNIQRIQYADKIYNIEHINEANFGFVTKKKNIYNQKLTKRLIEAAAAYSQPIKDWLGKACNQAPNWETQMRIGDKAKEIIAFSFSGVIGVQFSKLMAIGKEDDNPTQPRKYLTKCIHLVKYGLDLLNFTLIAHLWDTQTRQHYPLSNTTQNVQNALKNFFTSGFELSIAQRLNLFESLLQVFEQHAIALPLPELDGFRQTHLSKDKDFYQSVLFMENILEHLEKAEESPLNCAAAEARLAAMYAPLAFLVRYKMASIKFISYHQNKQSEPRYLHSYTALGIDSKANIDAEKLYFTTQTAETNSVWLYKGNDYKTGINLMPFALDYNALTFEQGARICFFMAQNINNKNFEYIFLDDQSCKMVEPQTVRQEDTTSSEWLKEDKHRITLNFNNVAELLVSAQKAFLTDVDTDTDFDIDFDNPNE